MSDTNSIAEAIASAHWPTVTARRSGRSGRFPFVPVLDYGTYTKQILGVAYANRDDALEYGARCVQGMKDAAAEALADPRQRALREYYGMPR